VADAVTKSYALPCIGFGLPEALNFQGLFPEEFWGISPDGFWVLYLC